MLTDYFQLQWCIRIYKSFITIFESYVFFQLIKNFKMNFSRAVKGSFTRSGVIREIDSQAELELGRSLTDDEKSKLFAKFPVNQVLDKIDKVNFKHN